MMASSTQRLFENWRAVWADKRGVTSLELALIAGLVSVAMVAGATTYGNKLKSQFSNVSTNIPNV